ncbi:unnamed protein product [Parnassius apollo]|uniref:(apollo) hypothetical protein n=1 Tax=Parnassius apollo TaxID=110799 RepID=A0A8S3WWI6_PARAO|nr:unnamed protein product [Parnassius apollo]
MVNKKSMSVTLKIILLAMLIAVVSSAHYGGGSEAKHDVIDDSGPSHIEEISKHAVDTVKDWNSKAKQIINKFFSYTYFYKANGMITLKLVVLITVLATVCCWQINRRAPPPAKETPTEDTNFVEVKKVPCDSSNSYCGSVSNFNQPMGGGGFIVPG